jgi:hypothetical protein
VETTRKLSDDWEKQNAASQKEIKMKVIVQLKERGNQRK